ncbi:MAG: hypothetical protein ACRC80_19990, partial [Waterburya sp.]
MAEIRIETRPVIGGYEHLYLVFRDDTGLETVIRGGPANDNVLNFGNIVTQVDVNLPTGTVASTFPGINNLLNFDTNLTGTSGVDIIRGGEGNDNLTGGAGNDILDGGEGVDTSIYSGSSKDYTIQFLGDNFVRITDTNGNRNGADTLSNIEFAEFSDGSVDLRSGSGLLLPPSPYAKDAQNNFNLAQTQTSSPLVLDLDGDGIELTALNTP